MGKILFFLVVTILTSGLTWAQTGIGEKKAAVTAEMNKQLDYYQSQATRLSDRLKYYQKKTAQLSTNSRKLNRKVTKLSTGYRRLYIELDLLRRDSAQLASKLEEAIANNQRLIQSYESRVLGMSGELRTLRDSLTDLKVVKHDLEMIKSYMATTTLAPREYDQPLTKVMIVLKETFVRANSPYKIKYSSVKEIVLLETFQERRNAFLFFKRNISLLGEYKLVLNPNPFDDTRTLVNIQDSFQEKSGKNFVIIHNYNKESEAQTRLFGYMDGVLSRYK